MPILRNIQFSVDDKTHGKSAGRDQLDRNGRAATPFRTVKLPE
jgi:hypothetical protein